MSNEIKFNLNGETVSYRGAGLRRLLDVLLAAFAVLESADNERILPIADFIKAPEQTALKNNELGTSAAIIGKVTRGKGVILRTKIGGKRKLIMLEGEQLPRIC